MLTDETVVLENDAWWEGSGIVDVDEMVDANDELADESFWYDP